MADSARAPWRGFESEIPAGATVVVDSEPLDCFHRLDYVLAFFDAGAQLKSLNLAVFNTDIGLATQVSGRHGAALGLSIDAFLNGSNAEIRVQNFEAFGVSLVASKLTT